MYVLLDRGRPSGVIDWGDICRGDPSMDMALCWFALTPEGRADFVAAYGAVSESQMLRGRVLAFFMCATLVLSAPNDTALRAARAGLERAT